MEQNNERITDRIRKMLALAADKAASEGERDNALRMAYATLAKYNIDLADVEASGQAGMADPRIFHKFDGLSTELWGMRVAQAIGELFFCKYYKEEGVSGHKHVFVGRTLNVNTATYMTEYVMQSIEREAKAGAKEHFRKAKTVALLLQQNIREAASPKKWADSFQEGAARAIRERVNQLMVERQEADKTPGTALALVSHRKNELALNMALIQEKVGRLGTARVSTKSVSEAAFGRGKEYGSSVSLNQQVGNSSATLRLGSK